MKMYWPDEIDISRQNMFGVIYHTILGLDNDSPDYQSLTANQINNIFAEIQVKYREPKIQLDRMVAALHDNFNPGHSEKKRLTRSSSADFEHLIYKKAFADQLGVLRAYHKEKPAWFETKETDPMTLMQGCNDLYQVPKKQKCTPYLRNRQRIAIVMGSLDILSDFKTSDYPKWLNENQRLITIIGRVKSFASALEKLIRRAAEYDILINSDNYKKGSDQSSQVAEKGRYQSCVRRDIIGVRVFVPVPEMVLSEQQTIMKALVQYKWGDRSLEIDVDDKREYNSLYFDIFSNYPEVHNRRDLELQLTSKIDFTHYEFCSDKARGLFDHYSSNRLRDSVFEKLGYVDKKSNKKITKKAELRLNNEYKQRYDQYAQRFMNFYEAAAVAEVHMPQWMFDGRSLLERNIAKIETTTKSS